jgi:hypothetical protein
MSAAELLSREFDRAMGADSPARRRVHVLPGRLPSGVHDLPPSDPLPAIPRAPQAWLLVTPVEIAVCIDHDPAAAWLRLAALLPADTPGRSDHTSHGLLAAVAQRVVLSLSTPEHSWALAYDEITVIPLDGTSPATAGPSTLIEPVHAHPGPLRGSDQVRDRAWPLSYPRYRGRSANGMHVFETTHTSPTGPVTVSACDRNAVRARGRSAARCWASYVIRMADPRRLRDAAGAALLPPDATPGQILASLREHGLRGAFVQASRVAGGTGLIPAEWVHGINPAPLRAVVVRTSRNRLLQDVLLELADRWAAEQLQQHSVLAVTPTGIRLRAGEAVRYADGLAGTVSTALRTPAGLVQAASGWTLDQAIERLEQAAELDSHVTAQSQPKLVASADPGTPQATATALAQAFARHGSPVWLAPLCPDRRLCGEGLQALVAVAEPAAARPAVPPQEEVR